MDPLLKLTKIKNLITPLALLAEKHKGVSCKPDDMGQSEVIARISGLEFNPSNIGGICS